ncbi:hypothetical protein E8P77_19365 [Soehngenia saccharolytica]|nr:hypothetical protein E8P77_19365 [Soehngenia saccharolytica]
MKIITENISYLESNIDEFINNDLSFLDIETTGLNSKYSYVYLIGVINFDSNTNSYKMIQYFAEDINEEALILKAFIDDYNPNSIVMTYNGDTFDIPFLKNRMQKHNITFEFVNTRDIYKDILKNKIYLDLDNYKLKTIEKFLGIERNDVYTGLDCIQFYKDYLKTQSEDLLYKILKHNYDDIYYLPKILKIYDIINNLKSFNVDFEKINYMFLIDHISNYESTIAVTGNYSPFLDIEINLYLPNGTVLLSKTGSFNIDFYVNKALNEKDQLITFVYASDIHLIAQSVNSFMPSLNSIIDVCIDKNFVLDNIKFILKNIVCFAMDQIISKE